MDAFYSSSFSLGSVSTSGDLAALTAGPNRSLELQGASVTSNGIDISDQVAIGIQLAQGQVSGRTAAPDVVPHENGTTDAVVSAYGLSGGYSSSKLAGTIGMEGVSLMGGWRWQPTPEQYISLRSGSTTESAILRMFSSPDQTHELIVNLTWRETK